ncbi:HD domain-containing phosphohydrolase [Deinococcus knuensis]|uniref:Diguanylate cyclase n=1 Tax=Deinococcus knuensis TaxID=1837380 RepID=A0ABQ2SSV4_9DEIO|nr:HD domain-containing phosphohydrolase [Deinococcus knuensis]GGS35534.1 diguanylate cyclase [Deinococcus knuensis]
MNAASLPSALTPETGQGALNATWAAITALLETDPAQAVVAAQACLDGIRAQDGSHWAALRTRLLLGRAQHAAAHLPEAAATLRAVADETRDLRDPVLEAEARVPLGKLLLDSGELQEAEEQLTGALSLTSGQGAPLGLRAAALNHLAVVRHQQGQVTGALNLLHEALDLREQEGDVTGQIHCLTNLGIIQMWFGQYGEAVATLTRAHALYQTQPVNLKLETPILHNLAHVHSANGDNDLATGVMDTAYQSAVQSRDVRMQAMASLNRGMFQLELGRTDEARASLQLALELSRNASFQVIEMHALDGLGTLHLQTGELDSASCVIRQALNLAVQSGSRQAELEARLQLGKLHARQGELGAAREELELALRHAVDVQSLKEEGTAHECLTDVLRATGELELALSHSQAALRIERELFNAERDRHTQNLSVQFEVTRARYETDLYRVRTEVEREGRETAEKLVRERTAELAQAQQEVVTRLAMAAEYRDDTTGDHTRRVGRMAALIALALGWPPEQAGVLSIAARLHDVGKIGIPDSVLLKTSTLEPDEYQQMQTHTLIGARILSGGRSELLRMAEEIARTHHERWDGTGYPSGLRGSEIPVTGRIVAVADVFDALTQTRPYKPAWTPAQAAEEIRRQRGTHFDPLIVDIALPLLLEPRPAHTLSDDDLIALTQEDADHVLNVFEQLLIERTRELEQARQEAVQLAAHMETMALTDSLTSLGNRRAFELKLEQWLDQSVREHLEFTVISLDLDGLKGINDRHGHARGDAYLQCFAQALHESFESLGPAYRIGGDEFAVLACGPLSPAMLGEIMTRVEATVARRGFPGATASSGSAVYPRDAHKAGELLHLSDHRMYEVKLARRHAPPPS